MSSKSLDAVSVSTFQQLDKQQISEHLPTAGAGPQICRMMERCLADLLIR
jgi:hypothetical protein